MARLKRMSASFRRVSDSPSGTQFFLSNHFLASSELVMIGVGTVAAAIIAWASDRDTNAEGKVGVPAPLTIRAMFGLLLGGGLFLLESLIMSV